MLGKNRLNSLFGFSRSDIRGIIVLLGVIITVIFFRKVLNTPSKEEKMSFSIIPDTANYIIQSQKSVYRQNPSRERQSKPATLILDPNKAGYYELIKVGMPEEVAGRIIHLRKKGVVFCGPGDLLKVYGMDSALLATLKSSLVYPEKREQITLREKILTPKVDINSCDSAELTKVPGLGPVLSSRIIKYRNLLGGFYAPNQITEVYGMSDSIMLRFSDYFEIDTSHIRKLRINSMNLKQLSSHPYITDYQAKAILSYRRLIGPLKTSEDLINHYLLPEDVYMRLLPYVLLN